MVEKLVIIEPREICLALGSKKVNRKFNIQPNSKTVEEDKNNICSFFEKYKINFDVKLLYKMFIKNVEEYEKRGFINPSYKILKERVERGEYEFIFL